MQTKFAEIETLLARIERLAVELRVDPEAHVRRSAEELRAAFEGRAAVEPAVRRMCHGIVMLRRGNQEGTRREFQRRAQALDYLNQVLEAELLPMLRRLGFDV